MNIIELVRSILQEFPKIGELVHIDYSANKVQDFGLSPTGDTLVSEDILGNQTRNHTFILYATCQSLNDYDRLVNSGMLLELQMWLERNAEGDIEVEVGDNILYGELKNSLAQTECFTAYLTKTTTAVCSTNCKSPPNTLLKIESEELLWQYQHPISVNSKEVTFYILLTQALAQAKVQSGILSARTLTICRSSLVRTQAQ